MVTKAQAKLLKVIQLTKKGATAKEAFKTVIKEKESDDFVGPPKPKIEEKEPDEFVGPPKPSEESKYTPPSLKDYGPPKEFKQTIPPVSVKPSEPIIDENQKIINEALKAAEGKSYIITYRTPSGEIKSFITDRPAYHISTLQGEFMSMRTPTPVGPGGVYKYRKDNIIYSFDISEQVLSTPSEKEKYLTGEYMDYSNVPSYVKEQVNLPNTIDIYRDGMRETIPLDFLPKDIKGDVESRLEQISYEKHLGLDTKEKEVALNKIISMYLPTTTPPTMSITEWKQEQWAKEKDPFLKLWQMTGTVLFNIPDPEYWSAFIQGKGAEYLYAKEYQVSEQMKKGDVLGAWWTAAGPTYENIVIPVSMGAAMKYIHTGYQSVQLGETSQRTAKAYKYFVQPSQKIIGYGVVPALVGTELGVTAAEHKEEAFGGWGSSAFLTKVGKLGLQFTMVGIGYKYYTPTPSNISLKAGWEKTKGFIGENIPGVYGKAQSVYTNIREFQYQNFDIRMAHYSMKQPFVSQGIIGYQGMTVNQRLQTGLRNVFFEPSASDIVLQSGLYDTKFLADVYRKPYGAWGIEAYPVKHPGIRDVTAWRSIQLPTEYETTILKMGSYPSTGAEAHLEQIAIRNIIRAKLEPLKYPVVKTTTGIVVHPEDPTKAFFVSYAPTQKSFSVGEIKMTGEKAFVVGKTYWKLGPKDVFYQERPFVGETLVESPIAYQDSILSESKGYLLSSTGKEMDVILSRGLTLQRDYFAGETFIKDGFFKQMELDLSLAISKGKFLGKSFGTYIDKSIVVKPKSQITDYFGETGGFDYRSLVEVTRSDIVTLPGGLGYKQIGDIEALRVFPQMYPSKPIMFEDYVYADVSGYWRGSIPSAGFAVLLIPRMEIKPVTQVKTSIRGVLDIQPVMGEVDLSVVKTEVKPVDITTTSLSSKTLLQQQSIQDTIQQQLTQQIQTQQVIAPTKPFMPLMGYTHELYPPEVPITTKFKIPFIPEYPEAKGYPVSDISELQGYDVMVKDRVYVHGKKKYSERFKKLLSYPLSHMDAMSLGANAVNESAAATFYIKPSDKSPRSLPFGVTPWNALNNMFYESNGKWIEKTDYRINTEGEIRGISALGWISEKKKQSPVKQVSLRKKETFGTMGTGFESFDLFDTMDNDFKKLFKGGGFFGL